MRRLGFVLLAAAAVLPLAVLLLASVGRDWFAPALLPPMLSGESWAALLRTDSALGAAALTSVLLATAVGLLAASVGLAVAFALAGLPGTLRHAGAALAFLPVITPPIALATALQYALLRAGFGGTFVGVLVAHAIPASGYAAIYLLGIVRSLDPAMTDEARTLGATRTQAFLHVTLPTLRGPLLDAFALGWLVSWVQVPLTLLVGGGLVRSLTVDVFAFARSGQDRFAATGALLLIVPAVLLLWLARRAAGRAEVVPA